MRVGQNVCVEEFVCRSVYVDVCKMYWCMRSVSMCERVSMCECGMYVQKGWLRGERGCIRTLGSEDCVGRMCRIHCDGPSDLRDLSVDLNFKSPTQLR